MIVFNPFVTHSAFKLPLVLSNWKGENGQVGCRRDRGGLLENFYEKEVTKGVNRRDGFWFRSQHLSPLSGPHFVVRLDDLRRAQTSEAVW
jgi:hypothetical protein